MGNEQGTNSQPSQPEEPSVISKWIDDLQKPKDPNQPEQPSAFSTWVSNIIKPDEPEAQNEPQFQE